MRVYLSSHRIGNEPEYILSMLGDKKKVALIPNASDGFSAEHKKTSTKRELDRLCSIGVNPEVVDLQDYFQKAEELEIKLKEFEMVWVRGGNSFILRKAFKQSGADKVVSELIKSNSIAYGGHSAGIVILTPSMKGLEIIDDPNLVPAGYSEETVWEGLNIVPFRLAPHFRSDFHESTAVEKLIDWYLEKHIPFIALKDGQALVIDKDKRKVVG